MKAFFYVIQCFIRFTREKKVKICAHKFVLFCILLCYIAAETTLVIVDFYGIFYVLFGKIITRTKLVLRITSFFARPRSHCIHRENSKIRPNQSSMDGSPSGACIYTVMHIQRVIYCRAHSHFSVCYKYILDKFIRTEQYYVVIYTLDLYTTCSILHIFIMLSVKKNT